MTAPDDPWLRSLLDSAPLDEPPEGADEAALAALGLGLGAATVMSSQAPLASSAQGLMGASKLLPAAAKLAAVLGVLGLGAIAWTSHHDEAPAARTRDSEPPVPTRASAAPLRLAEPMPIAEPILELGDDPKAKPARIDGRGIAHEPAPVAAVPSPEVAPSVPSALETETRILAAARKALTAGDKATARALLQDYDTQVHDGALQREAEILRIRAR